MDVTKQNMLDEAFFDDLNSILKELNSKKAEIESNFKNFENTFKELRDNLLNIVSSNKDLNEEDKAEIELSILVGLEIIKEKILKEYYTNRYQSEFLANLKNKIIEMVLEEIKNRKENLPQDIENEIKNTLSNYTEKLRQSLEQDDKNSGTRLASKYSEILITENVLARDIACLLILSQIDETKLNNLIEKIEHIEIKNKLYYYFMSISSEIEVSQLLKDIESLEKEIKKFQENFEKYIYNREESNVLQNIIINSSIELASTLIVIYNLLDKNKNSIFSILEKLKAFFKEMEEECSNDEKKLIEKIIENLNLTNEILKKLENSKSDGEQKYIW